jgi:hypothetical protein
MWISFYKISLLRPFRPDPGEETSILSYEFPGGESRPPGFDSLAEQHQLTSSPVLSDLRILRAVSLGPLHGYDKSELF